MDGASYASLDFVDLPFFLGTSRMATAYAQFTKNRYHAVKAAHPEKAFTEIAPLIAAEWRSLSQAQKNSYKNKIVRKTRKATSPPKSSSAAAPDYATARAAADKALAPTVERLQLSAHDLYLSMINAELRGGAAPVAAPATTDGSAS